VCLLFWSSPEQSPSLLVRNVGGEITTSNWRLMWLSILTAEYYLVGKQAAMNSCEFCLRSLQCGSVLKYSFALLGIRCNWITISKCHCDISRNSSSSGKTLDLFLVPPGARCRHGIRLIYSFLTRIPDLINLLLLKKKEHVLWTGFVFARTVGRHRLSSAWQKIYCQSLDHREISHCY